MRVWVLGLSCQPYRARAQSPKHCACRGEDATSPSRATSFRSTCANDDDDEAINSDDEALTAFEKEVGFDGAIARLDETSLARVDRESRDLESRGVDEATIDRLATRQVLIEAKAKTRSTSGIRLQSVYDLDRFKLNRQEQSLCNRARIKCVRVALAGLRARAASQSEYRDGNVGGRIDAFRHTYWNALMTEAVGADHAKLWADAHENGYPENRATERARVLSDMDFFNNAEGRKIGSREDPRASSKDLVREALTAGRLKAVRYDDPAHPHGLLVPSSACTDTQLCGR